MHCLSFTLHHSTHATFMPTLIATLLRIQAGGAVRRRRYSGLAQQEAPRVDWEEVYQVMGRRGHLAAQQLHISAEVRGA